MGFFNFLHKKQSAPETVTFSTLETWLAQTLERKNLGQHLQVHNQAFEQLKKTLQEALEALQNQALPAISEEEQRIVQENKEKYLERIHFFIEGFHPPQTIADLGYFTSKLSQDYDELLRSLEQTQYVVQQYLPTTLASVTGALQKISEYNGAFLRQLRDEHLDELREIQTQLNEYKKDHEKRQKFQQQKGEEEGQLAPLKQREEKILRRLTEYKKTSAYEEYQRLAQQKQPLMNELQKEKQFFGGRCDLIHVDDDQGVEHIYCTCTHDMNPETYSIKKKNKTSNNPSFT